MILVDTNVWSIAFRRRLDRRSPAEAVLYQRMATLLLEGDAALIGPIRQELLSGIKVHAQFSQLQRLIEPFTQLTLITPTYDLAADCFSRCRAKGIAADSIDMMVCAAAIENAVPILTHDHDFRRYATAVQIRLA